MIACLETAHGKIFVPDTDAAQYGWLKLTGRPADDAAASAVCALLDARPRGVAIDVGANFGCWSIRLARHASKVVAFEPQPPIYRCLLKTIAANPGLAIEARRVALGEEAGTISVPVLDLDKPANFGGVTLGIPHHEQPDAEMATVPVASLDGSSVDAPISFIKVDAEGAEPAILRGARAKIAEDRPLLFVEVVHRFSDAAALRRQIEGMGYATLEMGPDLLGMPI